MGEISQSDLDDTHWATSDLVRDHVDIPTKGGNTDVESEIESATEDVQSWWKNATDGDVPDDLPPTDSSDPNQLFDENSRLVRATALLAASYAHENRAQQIRSDEEGDRKHVFLERRAEKKFEAWKNVAGYGTTDTTESQGSDQPSSGKSDSLINL